MAVSQNQRLRKAAAKAAKRKAVVAEKLARDRRELSISKPRHIDFASSPIVACQVTSNIEEAGMGALTVVRKLSLGRYGLAVFLLDIGCLGVKDAFFRVASSDQYEGYMGRSEAAGKVEQIDPARARRLVRDAIAYGESNGFPPSASVTESEPIFGDVVPGGAPFSFGMGGKPHYLRGPHDSESRCKHILNVLRQRFGPDGFNYTIPFGDPVEDDYDFEDDFLEGEAHEVAAIADETEPADADLSSDESRAA